MYKIKTNSISKIRYHLQWAICFIVMYGGYQLYFFYQHFMFNTPYVERLPMVDGFLPIGALLSLRLWVESGSIHPVHPAATVILLSALIVSMIFKKSFCGWICPLGAFSDLIFKLGKKIFDHNLSINPYIDFSLRSIKYLFLCLVVYLSFVRMDANSIEEFLGTSFWKVADIKMLLFFLDMSRVTIVVLTVLFVLSLFFRNFWCRYLCPYGALTGLLGLLSPFKITTNMDNCVQCQRCNQSCPNLLLVNQMARINSPECNGCLTCISVCPSKKTLSISFLEKKVLRPVVYFFAVFMLFFAIIGVAQLTGNWESNIDYEKYKKLIPLAYKLTH